MRKTIALLLTLVMVIAIAAPVFAVDSPEANVIIKAVDANGNDVLPYLKAVDNDIAKAAKTEVNTDLLKSLLGTNYNENLVVGASYDVIYTGTVFPVTITFSVPEVKANKLAYVLHKDSAKGWEVLTPVEKADGTITVTFNSLSPVVFVTEKTTNDTSPGTGNNVALFAVLMLVSLAGTVVATKRVRA